MSEAKGVLTAESIFSYIYSGGELRCMLVFSVAGMGIDVIDTGPYPKRKSAKAQSFSTPMRLFTGLLSPQPAEEIDDVERVDVFERRTSEGVMPAGQEHFPRGGVVAVAIVEEYLRQIG